MNELPNDQQLLEEARTRGSMATAKTYLKLSGPGWLQSAITLGGGSLASALFLGVIGGVSMLWVQPLAMLMGLVMLAAISYVTLSTGRSPFDAIRREINPVLAWGWLLSSLLANMVWAVPQYALAYGAITENLFPSMMAIAGADGTPLKDGLGFQMGISLLILVFVTVITLSYGKNGLGLRVYEWILKALVGVIVLSFFGVVVQLARVGNLPWTATLMGFIPDWHNLVRPTDSIQAFLDTISDAAARNYWETYTLGKQREIMVGAAAAAVGINMTFLMPYSLLARRWGKAMRSFAIFDLALGMFVPFVVATGCIVVAAAAQFHGKPLEEIGFRDDGSPYALSAVGNRQLPQVNKLLVERRQALPGVLIQSSESRVAAMLVARDNQELALSLKKLFGSDVFAQRIFGIGVLAMALSSISLMMVISGFCVCEATGSPHGGRMHRLGMFCAASGAFWPFLWSGESKAYLAVVASTVGYTFLPIAFLAFFLMMNSRKILGDDRPKGTARIVWNVLIGTALAATGAASAWTAWNISLFGFPIGKIVWALFCLLLIGGAFHRRKSNRVPG